MVRQQLCRVPRDIVEVHQLALGRMPPRQREEVAHDRGATIGSVGDVLGSRGGWCAREVLTEQIRVARHGRQGIVQLVSDPGQHCSHRGQLLSLVQGFALATELDLSPLALRHVAHDGRQELDGAVRSSTGVNSRGRALPTARTATRPSGPTNDATSACPESPKIAVGCGSPAWARRCRTETRRSRASRSAKFWVTGNRSGSAARSLIPSQATGHSTPASKSHRTLASTLRSSRAALTTRRRTSSRSLIVMSDFARSLSTARPSFSSARRRWARTFSIVEGSLARYPSRLMR